MPQFNQAVGGHLERRPTRDILGELQEKVQHEGKTHLQGFRPSSRGPVDPWGTALPLGCGKGHASCTQTHPNGR